MGRLAWHLRITLLLACYVEFCYSCTPSTRTGYVCERTVDGGVLHWELTASNIRFAAVSQLNGWVGMGSGTGMVGAEVVVGGFSGTPETFRLSAQSFSGFNPRTLSWVVASAFSVESGRSVLTLTRDRNVGSLASVDTVVAFATEQNRNLRHNRRSYNNIDVTITPGQVSTSTPVPFQVVFSPSPTLPRDCILSSLSDSNYVCEYQVNEHAVIHWGLETDRVTLHMVMVFNTVAAGVSGFISYGISSSGTMLGGQVVVSNRSTGYELTAHSVEGVSVSMGSWLTSTETSIQNGIMSLKQTRTIQQSGEGLNNVSLIMAFHNNSAALTHHSGTVQFNIDINEGSIGPKPTPVPTFERTCRSSSLLTAVQTPYTCSDDFLITVGSESATGTVHWKLHVDLKTVSIAVQVPVNIIGGYSCLGITTTQGMINTSAVCIDPNRSIPSEHYLISRSVAGVLLNTVAVFSSKTASVENGLRTIQFVKVLSDDEIVHLKNGNLAFVFAGHSSAIYLTHHDFRIVLAIDLYESLESGPRITPAPTFSKQCEPSMISGYNCVVTLHPSQSYEIKFNYAISADRLRGRISVEYNADVIAGFFAIGFSNCSCMLGSSVVSALTQSGVVDTHLLVERSVMGVTSSTLVALNIFNITFSRVGTSAFLNFEFNIPESSFGGTHPFGSSFSFGVDSTTNTETLSVDLVYSYHTTAASLTHHWGNRGSIMIDLQDAIDNQLALTPIPTITRSCTESELVGGVLKYPCATDYYNFSLPGPLVKLHYGASASYTHVKIALEVDFTGSASVGFSAIGIPESASPCDCMLGNEAVVGKSITGDVNFYQLSGHYITDVIEKNISAVSFENSTLTRIGQVTILEATWRLRDSQRTAPFLKNYPMVFSLHENSPYLLHHSHSGVIKIDILDSVDNSFSPVGPVQSLSPTSAPTVDEVQSVCVDKSSEIGYHCVELLSSSNNIRLHWKVLFSGSGSSAVPVGVSFLITASISGWVALSFPTSPASMFPSISVVSYNDGVSDTVGIFKIDGRSSSDIQPSASTDLSMLSTEKTGNGVRVGFRYVLGSSKSVPLNWAFHTSNSKFPSSRHIRRGAVKIEFTTGKVSKYSLGPSAIIDAHSYIGGLVWFLIVPLSIAGKRYAAQFGFVFGKSIGHSLHNIGMIMVTLLTTVVFVWCINFSTPTNYLHAHTGLALFGLCWVQLCLTLVRPGVLSENRRLWNIVHRSGAVLLTILAIVCCSTGVVNQVDIYHDEPYFQYILVMIVPLSLGITLLLKHEFGARQRRRSYFTSKQRSERDASEMDIRSATPPRPFDFPIREVDEVDDSRLSPIKLPGTVDVVPP